MENRFLCRGKIIGNGEWVEGFLVPFAGDDKNRFWQIKKVDDIKKPSISQTVRVNPSTICQCAGYEGIYEKDIFQCDDERYVIEWCDYSLCWEAQAIGSSESISLGEFRPDEIVAIGNAIDNPELLEV